jgi:hypothetical protein
MVCQKTPHYAFSYESSKAGCMAVIILEGKGPYNGGVNPLWLPKGSFVGVNLDVGNCKSVFQTKSPKVP